jgi:hypothetical protein
MTPAETLSKSWEEYTAHSVNVAANKEMLLVTVAISELIYAAYVIAKNFEQVPEKVPPL